MRFVEDKTQQEIGNELGVTQMQASRLLKRILDQLRGELGADTDRLLTDPHRLRTSAPDLGSGALVTHEGRRTSGTVWSSDASGAHDNRKKWLRVAARGQELGELIDQLGVRQQIDPDENVCGAVVLLTVEEPDGHVSLRCAWSEGMTWIERIGVLRAAERAELPVRRRARLAGLTAPVRRRQRCGFCRRVARVRPGTVTTVYAATTTPGEGLSMSPTGPGDDSRADVELRLPADSAYVSVLRTTSAGLAARLDFTLDDIEDLRMAVGEATALVLPEAEPGLGPAAASSSCVPAS